MSADLFDLAGRFRAAHTGRVQPRMVHSPVWPGGRLVAALVRKGPDGIQVEARRRGAPAVVAAGPGAVGAFGSLGEPGSDFECLVVADRRQLALLVEAAHASPASDFALNRNAAVVDWWGQQAEHPGSRAVIVLTDACRQRWVTGEAPDAEAEIGTWLRWLDIPSKGVEPTIVLLDLAETVADGPLLASFDPKVDEHSWSWLRDSANGDFARAWRYPDSPRSAAVGCRARCDAADHYARALVDDPAWAERETHSGRVVDGQMVKMDDGLRVVTVQEACRFREGSRVCVADVAAPPPGPDAKPCVAVVEAMSWDASTGARVLDLRWTDKNQLPVGAGVTVRLTPEVRSPGVAARGRGNLATRFSTATWLTQPRKVAKPVIRRNVPLDIVVATAGD